MHIDARTLDNGTEIQGDICIVGSGAAGLSMALDWIDSGFKVILLEGRGFEYDDEVQELYAGNSTGQRYYPLRSSRLHYFGGTTGHWGGSVRPMTLSISKREPGCRRAAGPFPGKTLTLTMPGPTKCWSWAPMSMASSIGNSRSPG